ncbi:MULTISPECIES: MFS transporter permease [unclassified Curtobacterium]|uniref:MFS transporter permease n=1 Tax=unclassified Curtobacterium TaxID=257496 RepID=UPI0028606972|nr:MULTISPECIES: MFS transporter permease [unclassified Curtobacterium]MDR6169051.1 ABC-type transport system involved in multi-copper enzyme maturation permease subunit [Curtobacterium sp. SORGH_AS_0776]MDR6571377.1 ABC-type transport system involved in multi-copper enzyme maturation permease subunit [Curtobacterium sp. 320]
MTTAWSGNRRTKVRRPRPRGVWIASGIGVVLVLGTLLGAFLPLVGFLGGVTATTAGLVPFPFVRVTIVALLGAVVVLGLLLLAFTRRHTTTATIAVVLAVLISIAVTAVPVVLVAVGSADRAGDVWPIVTELWNRFTG